MSRPLRIEFEGGLYHVTSRGDDREDIYINNSDRLMFLDILSDVCERFNWIIHAYCLMGNHYHLLVETPNGNLSKGMRQLNGVYTQRFNHRHDRVGHVFQGRYKAILVEKEGYFLELIRYIVLNPVRAGMVSSAKSWPWSSYRATAGLAAAPDCLKTDRILQSFSEQGAQASLAYIAFVAEGRHKPSPWENLKQQIYLGSDDFVEKMQRNAKSGRRSREVPKVQKQKVPASLEYFDQKYHNRNEAIARSYASGGYSMKQIGEHFKLHYSWVSRIVGDWEKAKNKT